MSVNSDLKKVSVELDFSPGETVYFADHVEIPSTGKTVAIPFAGKVMGCRKFIGEAPPGFRDNETYVVELLRGKRVVGVPRDRLSANPLEIFISCMDHNQGYVGGRPDDNHNRDSGGNDLPAVPGQDDQPPQAVPGPVAGPEVPLPPVQG